MISEKWNTYLQLKENNEILRMGIPFSTRKKDYFYDTGTGKVVELNQKESDIFKSLFNHNDDIDKTKKTIDSYINQEELADTIINENLLSNPVIEHFICLDDYYKEENIQIQQLIIELTGKCNLRCKYCIYNDYYDGNRNFNTNNITFDIAKKAIDYAYKHRHNDRFSITFYGGEPLINFDVMRQCIDYSLENLTECELGFSFTTNLTLMTEDIAEYLGKVPNLSIVLSMDGPANIHNMARVYANNKPTFDDAYKGLKHIAKAAKKYGNITLTFNSVLMPPYTEERFDQISDFFASMDFLPENVNVQASYPSQGTVPESYYLEIKEKGYDLNAPANWFQWAENKSKGKDFLDDRLNLYTNVLEASLTKIHNRVVFEKPIGTSYFNGCCIPGQRRLYVCTDGTYKVCERVGNSPAIGNVDQGINPNLIKKCYLKDYEQQSIKDCSQCWALRLCDICYADCYDENGINIAKKKEYCEEVRSRYRSWLIKYYETIEDNMEIIEGIDKIAIN